VCEMYQSVSERISIWKNTFMNYLIY
jgi:hypothetical protein